ncbi:MAG: hypothetical protein PHQ14_11160 [Chromatiales bacterium]|jgi:hypothetical protein|nr:hypothetical protein [Chromatiales bacterium]MDX9765749.1 hypothetical protein [Ectothiorhodospiraceae bacterium]
MRALALLLLPLLCLAGASHAQLAVVAGKDSSIAQLDEREVADIFLARTTRLPDGSRVKVFELGNDAYRAVFYREVAGKTLPQINSYWTTLIFTGKGRPPRSIGEERALVDLLNSDPHAIGYLPLDQANESVKILFIVY